MKQDLRFGAILALSMAPLLSACGNTINCELAGDNIRGHILYRDGVAKTNSRRVIVQVSTDSFASVSSRATSLVNTQGLIVIPYEYCAANDVNLSFRAFEDTNSNGQWDSGEPTGRYDRTDNGNATYVTHNLPTADSNAVPPVDWEIQTDVNITLDGTTAQ